MNSIQSIIDSIIFSERFVPPNNARNESAALIHCNFWEDSYNRNLRLEDVEIEVRLGKCPLNGRGSFNTYISKRQFTKIIESLQGFTNWDKIEYTEDMVGYFPEVDESLRHVVSSDGVTKTISKQKVIQADYIGKNLPFDFRLAVNIELNMEDCENITLKNATKINNRKRHSFTLQNFRYDLTRVIDKFNNVNHQIEIELINISDIQLRQSNAFFITRELQLRIVSMLNALEPIRSFDIQLLRKKNF